MRSKTDPHPVWWMRDGELLRSTTESEKSLRLGGGREADGGAWGFTGFGGLGVRMGGEGGGGSQAWGRACPKCRVSYQRTPTGFDTATWIFISG